MDIDPEVASPLITDNPDGKSPLQLDIAKVHAKTIWCKKLLVAYISGL